MRPELNRLVRADSSRRPSRRRAEGPFRTDDPGRRVSVQLLSRRPSARAGRRDMERRFRTSRLSAGNRGAPPDRGGNSSRRRCPTGFRPARGRASRRISGGRPRLRGEGLRRRSGGSQRDRRDGVSSLWGQLGGDRGLVAGTSVASTSARASCANGRRGHLLSRARRALQFITTAATCRPAPRSGREHAPACWRGGELMLCASYAALGYSRISSVTWRRSGAIPSPHRYRTIPPWDGRSIIWTWASPPGWPGRVLCVSRPRQRGPMPRSDSTWGRRSARVGAFSLAPRTRRRADSSYSREPELAPPRSRASVAGARIRLRSR